MMNIRQRSVNVSRDELLKKLKANLEVHRKEYQEALIEYHTRLQEDLRLALKKVGNVQNIQDLEHFHFHIPFPQNHEKDYEEVIEMLEMSVDATINLDSESFKAYIKNEWNWQHHFLDSKAAYAVVGSSFKL